MIIDKFDPNLVMVNTNKFKPYRFMEDKTFQPILAKLNDFLSKEPKKEMHYNNLSTKQQIDETHFDNLLNA